MLNRFNSTVYWNTTDQITTGTTNIMVGPVDISSFETLSILFQNQHTAISLVALEIQVAQDPSANIGTTGAPNWVTVPTASVPIPNSAGIAATASFMTSAIANAYHWLRVRGGMSATAVANFRVTVGGFTRR